MTLPRYAVLLLPLVVGMSACSNVAYTNRTQVNLVSAQEEDKMGHDAFAEVKSQAKISTDPKANAMLQRVGKRIAAAANKPDYKWEFILIDEPNTINAFCLPGGRVAFYTGILPVTQDEAGMATVMSHEVAHALAHHGAERMTQQKVAGGLQAFARKQGYIKNDLQSAGAEVLYKYGVGLPHGRSQELEADHIGLILMAKSGYDPKKALAFWTRMSAAGSNKKMAFMSTHPSDQSRIKKIEEEMPEALTHYKPK